LNILIAIVIALFIIVAVYVGYHVSQRDEVSEGHSIMPELEILHENSGLVQMLQNHELRKTIL
jgi:hypothetical protein